MGKRKVLNEAQLKEMVLAGEGEMYGQVIKLVGSDHLIVKCADGKTRLGRIRGKIRRRVWIRLGDIVLLVPWDFANADRCDIIWRYTVSQVEWLRNSGKLPPDFQ
ncbi:MAG: translation initiation factor eIF-1A [Nitrososphaerales archaeon]